MRLLFDQGVPVPLRDALTPHEVFTTYECGWSKPKNGELLDAAERKRFALLVTTDSNLRYQQNLMTRRLAIVVLLSTSWPRIKKAMTAVAAAINASSPGSYTEVNIP